MTLNIKCAIVVAALAAAPFGLAGATGLATCDSGSPDTWQPQEKLTEMLKSQGWEVRKIKVDGGCYEVYAIDDKGGGMAGGRRAGKRRLSPVRQIDARHLVHSVPGTLAKLSTPRERFQRNYLPLPGRLRRNTWGSQFRTDLNSNSRGLGRI